MSGARRTALLSLVAAVALTFGKLAVGLATGSLGIVAEAAHSGVDAAAALLTFYAVGVAERPADAAHQFGHGKAQHLSALAEASILAALAGWVMYEGIGRLGDDASVVDATWWAFAFLGLVLVVDAARTAASLRASRVARSAALQANAAHFASDFAGTLAVIVGLAATRLGAPEGDAIAAMFVAVLVLVAAASLAARNVNTLMDRAPAGLAEAIARSAGGVSGVGEVRSVRVRESGGEVFAEVVIGVPRLAGIERSHLVMDAVEDAVEREIGPSQVTVHAEPSAAAERANDAVTAAALRVEGVMEVHNVTVLDTADGRDITLHARVDESLSLGRASDLLARLRDEIVRESGAGRVWVHLEPLAGEPLRARDVSELERQIHTQARAAARTVVRGAEVVLYLQAGRLVAVVHAFCARECTVRDAHAIAGRVEDAVRVAVPALADVVVEIDGA